MLKDTLKPKLYAKVDRAILEHPNGADIGYLGGSTEMIKGHDRLLFSQSQNGHDLFHFLERCIDRAMIINPNAAELLINSLIDVESPGRFDIFGERVAVYLSKAFANLQKATAIKKVDINCISRIVLNGDLISGGCYLKKDIPETVKLNSQYMILKKSDIISPTNFNIISESIRDDLIGTLYVIDKDKSGRKTVQSLFEEKGFSDFQGYFKRNGETSLDDDLVSLLKNGQSTEKLQVLIDFFSRYFKTDISAFIKSYPSMLELINSGIIGPKGTYIENEEYYIYPILPNGKCIFLEIEYAKLSANQTIFDRNHFKNDDVLSSQNLGDFTSESPKSNDVQTRFNNLDNGRYGMLRNQLKHIDTKINKINKLEKSGVELSLATNKESEEYSKLKAEGKHIENEISILKETPEYINLFTTSNRVYGYTDLPWEE